MSDDAEAEAEAAMVASLLSNFVDTFVDYCVSGGLFLLPPLPFNQLETEFTPTSRLVAIGDIHGDLGKAKQALRLAELIDATDRWSGGSTTLVQIGDILDRGKDELKLLYLFEKLKREAAKQNGRVITMNGNHETMNIAGDFRYIHHGSLEEFQNWGFWYRVGVDMKRSCIGFNKDVADPFAGIPDRLCNVDTLILSGIRCRIAALRRGGPISTRFLSRNKTVVVVGKFVFAHGGLMPIHVRYNLDMVNRDVSNWIQGITENIDNHLLWHEDSIVLTRKFSVPDQECDCSTLQQVLDAIPGVKRMIVGHTPQIQGINTACECRVIRIDVGMSRGSFDAYPEVLEIKNNSKMKVLSTNPLYSHVPRTLHKPSAWRSFRKMFKGTSSSTSQLPYS